MDIFTVDHNINRSIHTGQTSDRQNVEGLEVWVSLSYYTGKS